MSSNENKSYPFLGVYSGSGAMPHGVLSHRILHKPVWVCPHKPGGDHSCYGVDGTNEAVTVDVICLRLCI